MVFYLAYHVMLFILQAEVEGQKITWLAPHSLQQVLTDDVDFNVMLTFLEFYEVRFSYFSFSLYRLVVS